MIPLLLLAITHMRGLKAGERPPADASAYRAAALENSSELTANVSRRAANSNLSVMLDAAAKAVHEGIAFADAAPELSRKMLPKLLARFEQALRS